MSLRYKGKIYYEYNNEITSLIRLGRLDNAEKLLRELIATIDSESNLNTSHPLSWYYATLANVYHMKGDLASEIKTLETFVMKNKGARTSLHERLENLTLKKPL